MSRGTSNLNKNYLLNENFEFLYLSLPQGPFIGPIQTRQTWGGYRLKSCCQTFPKNLTMVWTLKRG